ncbi:TPR-like protein [Piromyces finnis]|uniref:TPR-like protein n=1 Tax=Piromyces finnis TaxID=1754191 RepID=A0A1Y1V5D2_9FUNG|nr:TPR-like protein [Piromyces finnis]|eukprot:ORX47625.1 TPR-like protein [Piromyces finnis]
MSVIEIPLKNSEEVLEVSLSDLHENSNEILNILNQEEAPLALYLNFALEYYKRSMFNEFEIFLQQGSKAALATPDQQKQHLLILNCLASYQIKKAKQIKLNDPNSQQDKKYLFEAATSLFNAADKIDIRETTSWIGKGILLLTKGQIDKANNIFKAIVDTPENANNIPALLGKACISFYNKDYKGALASYQRILKYAPDFKPNVRIPIGLCFYALGNTQMARKAFERVLNMEPDNVDALIYLSILDLNQAKEVKDETFLENISKGREKLKKAYKANYTNPVVALQLADYCFNKKEYEKVKLLANIAYTNTNVAALQALAYYNIGRVHQVNKNYDKAYKAYAQAIRLDQSNVLAQFGMGQMHLFKNEISSACECFEKVLVTDPNNYDVLKILGCLYSKLNYQKAMDYYDRISRIPKSKNDELNESNDYEVWIDKAKLLEQNDPKAALKAYYKAAEILESSNERVPPELWNNIAVLYHLEGDLGMAEQMYQKAYSECSEKMNLSEVDKEYYDGLDTSISYNVSRLYETQREPSKASVIYNKIIKNHSRYLDAYLRLGAIEVDQGNYDKGIEYYKKVLEFDPKNVDAYSLKGYAYSLMEQIRASRKTYEKILKDIDRYDLYALCAVGNIYLIAGRSDQTKQGKETYYKRAVELFDKALRLDNQNVYAANGIAIALAERGYTDVAKNLFIQIREVKSSVEAIWINLGHIYTELGQYQSAINNYENCLKKLNNISDIGYIYQCLAKAYFGQARTEKKVEYMNKAENFLQKALFIKPRDRALQFDLALIKQEFAQLVIDQQPEARTIENLKKALNGLNISKKYFAALKDVKNQPVNYDVNIASRREEHNETVRKAVIQKLEEQEKIEKKKKERMDNIKLQRQKELKERELKKEEELRKAIEEEKRIERQREELALRLEKEREEEIMIEEQLKEKKKAAASKSKSHNKDFIDDDEEGNMDYEDSDEDRKIKKKRKRNKRKHDIRDDESDNDEDKKNKSDKEDDLNFDGGDSDDDEDIRSTKKRKKYSLSKDTISDEDDDDDDEIIAGNKSSNSSRNRIINDEDDNYDEE